jgi:hypothetical protein
VCFLFGTLIPLFSSLNAPLIILSGGCEVAAHNVGVAFVLEALAV